MQLILRIIQYISYKNFFYAVSIKKRKVDMKNWFSLSFFSKKGENWQSKFYLKMAGRKL